MQQSFLQALQAARRGAMKQVSQKWDRLCRSAECAGVDAALRSATLWTCPDAIDHPHRNMSRAIIWSSNTALHGNCFRDLARASSAGMPT